jgi:hypothetical protein
LEINVRTKFPYSSSADLKHLRSVSIEEATSFSQKNSLHFMETSALDGTMVETAFQNVLEDIYQVCNNVNVQNGGITTQVVSQPGGNSVIVPQNQTAKDPVSEQGKCC